MRRFDLHVKRVAAVVLASVLTFSAVGCGKGASEETTTGVFVPDIEFASVTYEDSGRLVVRVKSAFEGEAKDVFVIKDANGDVVPFKEVSVVLNTNLTFTFDEALDPAKDYTITYGNVTANINMPYIYSESYFEEEYTYDGDDLGVSVSGNVTTFKVWSPLATKVSVNVYKSGTKGTDDKIDTYDMEKTDKGVWIVEVSQDLTNSYYTYSVTNKDETVEACDPYAKSTGVNGDRAMIIDLEATNPEGWENDKNPNAGISITDAIIYELHLRDMSADASSGITNVGKYLSLTETGTTNTNGESTGLDYIKDLGVNYVHIMPMYDYGSVDETKLDEPQYNWGYDPVNFNVPEGSYSTDPYDGTKRVSEAKEMVKALHDNGISVIMDVVYNHVYSGEDFCFNEIVPNYFSRVNTYREFSNGSGCGNDTASERSMVKKYIVDSVTYWANEYHIDGFRFDLVGLIDVDTINAAIEEVHKTNPDVIFYGEGWSMKTSVTKKSIQMTTQSNSALVPGFAFFNDYFRDNVRGSNSSTLSGYGTGDVSTIGAIKSMLAAKTNWTTNPSQIINYSGCHDNNALFDKITMSHPEATIDEKAAMNKLVAAITLTSQGTPFLMSGEELLRTKVDESGTVSSNSYNATDFVNSIKWDTLNNATYQNVRDYYKGLIAFRKAHAGLRMQTAAEVDENITIMDNAPDDVLAYEIKGGANGEASDGIFVIYNGTSSVANVPIPQGVWTIYVNGETAGTTALGTATTTVAVDAMSAMVLVLE